MLGELHLKEVARPERFELHIDAPIRALKALNIAYFGHLIIARRL